MFTSFHFLFNSFLTNSIFFRDDTILDEQQLQGIIEYIPTKEEKQLLRKYMTSSDKNSADAFDELCECEKFMVAMMTVKHSKQKMRALLFRLQFHQCISDLERGTCQISSLIQHLFFLSSHALFLSVLGAFQRPL